MFRGIKTKLFDDKQAGSFVNALRRRRFRWFRELLDPMPRPVTLLDVGGTEWFWRMMGVMPDADTAITLLNLMPRQAEADGFVCEVGDGCHMPQFADGQFDIVVSNSVIEHVGDWVRQQAFAAEIRRVGKAYFVQTPNRRFPIEAHTHLPGFQYWPMGVQARLLARRNLGVFPRQSDRAAAEAYLRQVRLLTGREMQQLFPEGTLVAEKLCGLTKSWLAMRRMAGCSSGA